MTVMITDEMGRQRPLEPYEAAALKAAQDEHEAEQAANGVFTQWDADKAQRALLAHIANAVDIPAEQAVHMRDVYPAWDAGATYQKGFRVNHGGALWTCLQEHSAQAGWAPGEAPSLWAKVLLVEAADGSAPEWQQPDSTNAYQKGDRVSFGGKTYVSTVDGNVWSPADYPQGWEEVDG